MAKIAGRWIKVMIDDSGGTAREVSTDVDSIDLPLEYAEVDVTGFSEGMENSMPGILSAPIEISGTFNPAATTGLYTVLKDIVGDHSAHTVTIQIGNNAAPSAGDPEFEGEYWCSKLSVTADPKGKVGISASLRPYGSTAPAWGTVSA